MTLSRNRLWWLAIATTAILSAASIFPLNAKAQSQERIELTFDIYDQVNYDLVQQQAENLARRALNEAFAEGSNTSEVVLVIMANHSGQIVPVFSVNVSRSEWQEQPNLAQWITWATPSYSSETLLALRDDASSEPSRNTVRQTPPRRVDNRDLLENDPAFRDD